MNLSVQSTSVAAHMASSQNTTYYPCPLWGKKFEDIVETAVDPAGNKYRFIRRSWFNLLSPVRTATEEPAILIRDPYEALYSVLTQRSSPSGPEDPYSGIAVIGQPGIGKSLFLPYALLRRLCEKRPTALQHEPDIIWTFEDGEIRKHTPFGADSGSNLPRGAWGLCDSNASLKIPSAFMMRSDVFTIQATPPQQDCYAQWIKEKKGLCYYMEVFSEQEIKQLGHLLRVPRAIDMYHLWGPSARDCIALARDQVLERQHENSVRNAATLFASDPPTASYPGEGLALVAGSHKLFCLKPEPGDEGFIGAQSTVISPHVQLIIQNAASRERHEKRKRFYEIFSAHPHCRSVMGWLLEQQFHRWIGLDADSQAHDAAAILECTSRPQRKRLPMLYLKPTREEPLNGIRELATATGLPLPIYYHPTSERFAGVDGLILTDDAVILTRATVSSKHALKREHLVPLYNNLPVSIRRRPWKFVWVVPERDIGEVLVKRKFNVGVWPKIEFYWCLFPFNTREGASEGLRLDIPGTEIEEDEGNIEMWATDEDDDGDGDYQDDSGPSPKRARKGRKGQGGQGH